MKIRNMTKKIVHYINMSIYTRMSMSQVLMKDYGYPQSKTIRRIVPNTCQEENVSTCSEENNAPQCSLPLKRKRRNQDNWNCNKRKKDIISGEGKAPGPPGRRSCRTECFSKITDDERKNDFIIYYRKVSHAEQWLCLMARLS